MVTKQKMKNGKKAPEQEGQSPSVQKGKLPLLEPQVAVGISHGDVNSFLKKFKADVAEKTKKYREFAQESRKKKN